MAVQFRGRDQEGAVAITTALLLVVLILLAAFLVDLGGTRADARTDQLLADAAITAGAAEAGDVHAQCRAAIAYFAANVGAGAVDDSSCADLPLTCDPEAPPAATPTDPPITVGDYTVTIWHPVPDDDPAMDVQGQTVTERDGDLCDRMKIEVRKGRDFTFSGAGGTTSSGGSVNDAVARRRLVLGEKEYATLVVVDRTGCASLQVRGGSQALVEDHPEHRGLISVDTTGALCGASGSGQYAMTTEGSNARICAGVEDVDAIRAGGPCVDPSDGEPRIFSPANRNGKAAFPDDVTAFRVRPVPETDVAVTRAPADHTWNCMENYGSPGEPWLPTDGIEGCEDGHDPYIEDMASKVANSAAPAFTTLGPWDTTHSGNTCSLSGTVGAADRNIYLNCDEVVVPNGATLQIQAKDYIVVKGTLAVAGTLIVDTGSDVVMAFQDGGLATRGNPNQVSLQRTAVYVHNPDFSGADNALNINLSSSCVDPPGGSPPCAGHDLAHPVEWTAPEGPAHDELDDDGNVTEAGLCETLTPEQLPSPECFEDMALWSNARDNHILKGLMNVRGVFFTPNAGRQNNTAFDLSGGASQPMRRAQFFSYRLFITGGSSVVMQPDPESILPTREIKASLIR